jgi:hypothetical protein
MIEIKAGWFKIAEGTNYLAAFIQFFHNAGLHDIALREGEVKD